MDATRPQQLDQRTPAVDPLPTLEEGDLLRFRGRWVALSARETIIARALVSEFDRCVTRARLESMVGGSQRSAALNSLVARLRSRIAPLGLTIDAIRGRGYVLTSRATQPGGATGASTTVGDAATMSGWVAP